MLEAQYWYTEYFILNFVQSNSVFLFNQVEGIKIQKVILLSIFNLMGTKTGWSPWLCELLTPSLFLVSSYTCMLAVERLLLDGVGLYCCALPSAIFLRFIYYFFFTHLVSSSVNNQWVIFRISFVAQFSYFKKYKLSTLAWFGKMSFEYVPRVVIKNMCWVRILLLYLGRTSFFLH